MNENKDNVIDDDDEWKQGMPVEPGTYSAKFLGAKPFEISEGQYAGKKWRWEFEIVSGEYTGRVVSGMSNRVLGKGSTAGRFMSGLLDRDLKPSDNVKAEMNSCVGKSFKVRYRKSDKGSSIGVQDIFQ